MLNGFFPNRMWRPVRYHAAHAIGALFVVLSCTDATTDPLAPTADARLDGRLGGLPYSARATALLKRTPGAEDSLYIYASRRAADSVTEMLRVRVAFSGVGTYVLGESAVRLMEFHFDEITTRFSGSQPSPGVLVITDVGTTGELVIGSVRFWLAPSSPAGAAPMEFTDGTFTVRLGAPDNLPQLLRDLRAATEVPHNDACCR